LPPQPACFFKCKYLLNTELYGVIQKSLWTCKRTNIILIVNFVLDGVMVIMLAIWPEVRRFKPGQEQWNVKVNKKP
jgi:hypothetical protein